MPIDNYLGYHPKKDLIKVTCKGADTLPIDRIIEFQGELKTLSKKNRDKLLSSIQLEGFCAPFFLWEDKGEYKLIDGHQRLITLLFMREKGWDIPLLPVDYIQAENEEEARRKLLKITSQYGKFNLTVLDEWINGMDEDIQESLNIFDKEAEELTSKIEKENKDLKIRLSTFEEEEEEKEIDEEKYTQVIKAPIYEPKEEKPPVNELYDNDKCNDLIHEIAGSNIEDKEIVEFLMFAAERHIVFNYEKIAEYYSHANIEIKELMEKSALVIIDYEKAIEGGYVELSKKLRELRIGSTDE